MDSNLNTERIRVAPSDCVPVLVILTLLCVLRSGCWGVLQLKEGAGNPTAIHAYSTSSVSLTVCSEGIVGLGNTGRALVRLVEKYTLLEFLHLNFG